MKKAIILGLLIGCNHPKKEEVQPTKTIRKISTETEPDLSLSELPAKCTSNCQVVSVEGKLYFCFRSQDTFHRLDDFVGNSTLYCKL